MDNFSRTRKQSVVYVPESGEISFEICLAQGDLLTFFSKLFLVDESFHGELEEAFLFVRALGELFLHTLSRLASICKLHVVIILQSLEEIIPVLGGDGVPMDVLVEIVEDGFLGNAHGIIARSLWMIVCVLSFRPGGGEEFSGLL